MFIFYTGSLKQWLYTVIQFLSKAVPQEKKKKHSISNFYIKQIKKSKVISLLYGI